VSGAIKFSCPYCRRVCKVPAELAGKQGRCPGCRKGLEVPLATTLSAEGQVTGRLPRASERGSRVAGLLSGALASEPAGDGQAHASARVPAAGPPCPHCQAPLAADEDPTECAVCGEDLPTPRLVIAAFALAWFPNFGLVLAFFGLRHARARGHHVGLARAAVAVNAVMALFGNVVYPLIRASLRS